MQNFDKKVSTRLGTLGEQNFIALGNVLAEVVGQSINRQSSGVCDACKMTLSQSNWLFWNPHSPHRIVSVRTSEHNDQ